MDLSSLTKDQLAFVNAPAHVVAIACPGSGKTSSLTLRCARVLRENPGESIALVTFAKPAAEELKARIIALVGKAAASRLFVGTFHGLAYWQLRNQNQACPKILSPADAQTLMERAAIEADLKLPVQRVVEGIERIKRQTDPHEEEEIMRAYEIYQRMLQHSDSMDFSDLVLRANDGMRRGVISSLPVKHLLLDEFQDADSVQFEWMEHHFRSGQIISVVGDDDQSIYGFRGALGHEGIERASWMTSALRILLSQNFRSSRKIVDFAAHIININQERRQKSFVATQGHGARPTCYAFVSAREEAITIREILSIHDLSTRAVIARTNAILDHVQLEFEAFGIPFRREGGESFWQHPAAAALQGLLDSVQTGRAIGAENALHYARVRDETLRSIHESKALAHPMKPVRARDKKTKGLVTALKEARETNESGSVNEVIVLASCWMYEVAPNSAHEKVILAAQSALTRMSGSLQRRLRCISMESRESPACDVGTITLCTMHGSKGREFDTVWVAGVNRDVCPHELSQDVEEERRLFYVAATRAKNDLYVSGVDNSILGPSPFYREAESASWKIYNAYC